MIHREDRFLDFRSRIRNADSHEEAEEILRDLRPIRIRRTCLELINRRGHETINGAQFVNDEFQVQYFEQNDEVVLARKTTDGIDIVFHETESQFLNFQPIRCWNVLNLLEELIEKGEIEI